MRYFDTVQKKNILRDICGKVRLYGCKTIYFIYNWTENKSLFWKVFQQSLKKYCLKKNVFASARIYPIFKYNSLFDIRHSSLLIQYLMKTWKRGAWSLVKKYAPWMSFSIKMVDRKTSKMPVNKYAKISLISWNLFKQMRRFRHFNT